MSTQAIPPPLPSAPRPTLPHTSTSTPTPTALTSPPQTHATFLFQQLFLILSQLLTSENISEADHAAVVSRLNRVRVEQREEGQGGREKDESEMSEKEKEAERGKRNAWVQKAVSLARCVWRGSEMVTCGLGGWRAAVVCSCVGSRKL